MKSRLDTELAQIILYENKQSQRYTNEKIYPLILQLGYYTKLEFDFLMGVVLF